MLLNDEVQLLRRVPLFAGVEPAKLKLLAFASDRLNYAPGQTLFRQGDAGDAAYVVLSGKAEVIIDSPAGPIKLAEMGCNAVLGEIAILCDGVRTATVKASTPLEVLRISKDHFLKLMSDNPAVTIQIMRVLAQRLTNTTNELGLARARQDA
ncbi:cyclic nucleotide-binding domain-containing protein [Sinorhizobium sp. BG8]|uniref:cyclic nucleotide-binding domain-containing protein n=1 Tax=Sinorhizobium sp. BG8 TaxID=2613773 RepID=UPI00193EBADF|nr:cyclic nucleotide-binding domain-containing protein [Sinorhizobium sp. BG8]QRM53875.1 cyclic nucleotide-binding domain-containing protein [Sinorhizobium sp. BG8]